MSDVNRLEELLDLLVSGNGVENWECLNRLEQYLICILAKKDISELGKPLNRLEVLLQALYYVVPDNSIEVIATRLEEQNNF